MFFTFNLTLQEEKENESAYKKWYSERQALRGNLDGMGLSEALLQRKTDKSELEKRVQTRLKAARLWKPESPPPPEPVPEEKEPPVVPNMKVGTIYTREAKAVSVSKSTEVFYIRNNPSVVCGIRCLGN